ncbi:MAG: hypothetical protein E6J62_01320 [Deltaproteobacteria bacterium]|nr:MAG: hypothetical protein E6J62_01320 [Deltaproteobacteria bacterium]
MIAFFAVCAWFAAWRFASTVPPSERRNLFLVELAIAIGLLAVPFAGEDRVPQAVAPSSTTTPPALDRRWNAHLDFAIIAWRPQASACVSLA